MSAGPPGRRLKSREMPTPHAGMLGDRDCIPVPTGRRPPLGPVEAFILSKSDGRRTIGDVGALAGLSVLEVAVLVARLEELGAVVLQRPKAADVVEDADLDDWTIVDEENPRRQG
jgi:hypothetical protein